MAMLEMILGVLPLLIAFGCGYGVRELISRHRRAVEREKFYQRHPEARPEESVMESPILDGLPKEARRLARDIASLPELIEQKVRKISPSRIESDR
jgi:hypothetical protein